MFKDGGVAEGDPTRKSRTSATPRQEPDRMPTKKDLRVQKIIRLAEKYKNLPYSFSVPPETDSQGNPTAWGCATSIAWLYKHGAHINLPSIESSYQQFLGLRKDVKRGEELPGDLIFQKNTGPGAVNVDKPVNHVEMYLNRGKIFNGGGSPGIRSTPSHDVVGVKRVIGKPGLRRAAGGPIYGAGTPTSDSIPAMLSNGEYVIRASSVAKYGKGFMDKVNSGSFSPTGFASGGFVGSRMPAPSFNMPSMSMPQTNQLINSVSNNYGGSVSNNSSNSSSVKIVVNAAQGQSTKAIANEVVKLINHSNSRRVHSRSI